MEIKKISLILCFLLLVLCFAGCKDAESDFDVSSNLKTTSSVPIVIVDDEDDSATTQSEIDKILNDWENNNPTVNIEVDTSDESNDLNSSNDNSSETVTSGSSNDNSDSSTSQEQEPSDNISADESSNNSSGTDSGETSSEDDGYFDVAVQSVSIGKEFIQFRGRNSHCHEKPSLSGLRLSFKIFYA